MQRLKLLANLSMPCGLCMTAAAVPFSKEPLATTVQQSEKKTLNRPSQLPIYVNDQECSPGSRVSAIECPPNILEEGFGTIRRGIQGLLSKYTSVTENFNTRIGTGYEHSLRKKTNDLHMGHSMTSRSRSDYDISVMLDYLREESNFMPRLGAVGIGGLTGLVLSLRGGKFKRLVYTSGGALSVAAVCYPKRAQDTFTLVKHYTNIGYNFVYGVKPGDENQLEIKWPEIPKIGLPSSASELYNLVADIASSLSSNVGSLTENTESKTIAAAPKPKDH